MWKQPLGVGRCTLIILHGEAQTFSRRNPKKNTFLTWGGTLNVLPKYPEPTHGIGCVLFTLFFMDLGHLTAVISTKTVQLAFLFERFRHHTSTIMPAYPWEALGLNDHLCLSLHAQLLVPFCPELFFFFLAFIVLQLQTAAFIFLLPLMIIPIIPASSFAQNAACRTAAASYGSPQCCRWRKQHLFHNELLLDSLHDGEFFVSGCNTWIT